MSDLDPDIAPRIGAVAIGRNEGARLVGCLESLSGKISPVVYVDSGSTDGSIEVAESYGAVVVTLDLSVPFTAARARNAGYQQLKDIMPGVEFVQFLDGDCELVDGWIDVAHQALVSDPELAVVCGRRRERFPEATLYNRLIDAEWDTPVGDALACGGDALIRAETFDAVGGYREDLIAGEEPEMCFRMRKDGWRIRRIDAEMTMHDAAIDRFSQWWQRARRAGHTYAEGFAIHGKSAERYNLDRLRRTVLWGMGLPVAAIGLSAMSPWGILAFLVWPLQILRLTRKGMPAVEAAVVMLAKFPEAQGVLGYWLSRLTGRRRRLIEYK